MNPAGRVIYPAAYQINFVLILVLIPLLVSSVIFGITFFLRRKKVIKFIPAILNVFISAFFVNVYQADLRAGLPKNTFFGLLGAGHVLALGFELYLTIVFAIAAFPSIAFMIFYGFYKHRKTPPVSGE